MGAAIEANGNTNPSFLRKRFNKKFSRRAFTGNQTLPLPQFKQPLIMRPRGPFPPGRMPPPPLGPRMVPSIPPGMHPPPMRCGRLPPPPPLPPGRMGPAPPMPLQCPGLHPRLRPLGSVMRPPPPNVRGRPLPLPPGIRQPPTHLIRSPMMMCGRGPVPGPRGFAPPLFAAQNKFKRGNKGKVMKKRRPNMKDIDLTKPWVTDMIKIEFNKKDELLKSAKATQKPEDWSVFRDQREKCANIYNTAKLEYIGQHPEEDYHHEEEDITDFSSDKEIEHFEPKSCDVCDRDFHTIREYQKHMSEHKTCGLDGCTFTAHEKIVEKHIFMQHSTGLYDKIKTLSTAEDIAKWREERKKRYPTKENIESRYKQQEEMLKRGERISPNKSRFGKQNKMRFAQSSKTKQLPRKTPLYKTSLKKKPKSAAAAAAITSLLNDSSEWNGKLNPFRGTSELYDETKVQEISNFDDSEWIETEINVKKSTVELNNSLGLLMGAYNYSDESDLDELISHKLMTESGNNTKNNSVNSEDCDAPLEVKIEKEPSNFIDQGTIGETSRQNNHPQKGKKRKKVKRNAKHTQHNTYVDNKNKNNNESLPKTNFVKRRVTLLETLLDNEIRHERNILLQCVRFIVDNNFFLKTTNKA